MSSHKKGAGGGGGREGIGGARGEVHMEMAPTAPILSVAEGPPRTVVETEATPLLGVRDSTTIRKHRESTQQ